MGLGDVHVTYALSNLQDHRGRFRISSMRSALDNRSFSTGRTGQKLCHDYIPEADLVCQRSALREEVDKLQSETDALKELQRSLTPSGINGQAKAGKEVSAAQHLCIRLG